jgi:uncharacterized protein
MQTLATDTEFKAQVERATLAALYYYPIKSCAGIQIEQAELDPCGIVHDRELMLVEAATGEFLTQRELPHMALIRPTIKNGQLQVDAPGMPALVAPLVTAGPSQKVEIWSSKCQAVDQGADPAKWFSEYLGIECRLVRMASDFARRVDSRYALSQQDQVNFSDGYPFLLISQESLDDLNSRLAEPLPMNRFRPNIVIAGSGVPFCEDRLKRVNIGSVTFNIVKPCARCPITTTDQTTAEVGHEPLKTLATFRRFNGKVMFGQNLIHENQATLKVGDKVEVLELKGV